MFARFVILLSLCLSFGLSPAKATSAPADARPIADAGPITVVDALGRTVTLPKPATRLVLAQARHMPVLGLVHPAPPEILVGWSDEYRTSFSNEYANYLERFPELADVAVIGRHTADSFSVERALAQRPDLIVLTASFAGINKPEDIENSLLLRQFENANVPVIVVDFFVDPLTNTVPSIRALGQAVGQAERTEAFIQLYESHMTEVQHRLAHLEGEALPPVFVHAHAGSTDCCNSPGVGTFNDMIRYAGGHNIGADALKTVTGRLNFEYILGSAPHVYVATGTGAGKRANTGLDIGTGVAETDAQASLQRIIRSNRLEHLPAIQHHNAHGIWHAFNDSPLHVVFIEALAAWIHPELFKDISPQATLDEINERFLTVPLHGTYMVDLP